MTRTLSLCRVTLGMPAAGHVVGCAGSDPAPDVTDPELTPDELAALPEVADPDHAGLDAIIAAEPPATFDTDEATELPYIAVDDTDEVAAASAIQALAAILKFGLHPRASDALRSIGVSASRIMQTIGNAPASAGTHAQDEIGRASCRERV